MLHGARAKGGRQGSGVGSVAIDFLIVSPAGFDTRVFSHSLPRGLNLCSWGGSCFLIVPIASLYCSADWSCLPAIFLSFVLDARFSGFNLRLDRWVERQLAELWS
jgi:hypothetical protein